MLGFEQMTEKHKEPESPTGHPLALDPLAESGSQTEPAFIARPAGAPVYHGFEVLSGVVVGSFTFGKITDFEIETCNEGDAFVVAPDNSRAGLVWEISDKPYFQEICARSETMGSLGCHLSKCYDKPRKCPQESGIYSSRTQETVGRMASTQFEQMTSAQSW